MRLSKSFVKDNAPQTEGVVRVNHNENGCVGDSDSCVIRMDSFGRITAKCYRCGAWLATDLGAFRPMARATTVIKREAQLPSDCIPAWHSMPRVGQQWLRDAHIDQAMSDRIGLQWSEKQKRLYIPARNIHQQWWTGRTWEQNGPRYKTLATFKDSCFGFAQANRDRISDRIWIVEDLLSMYRVADAGMDCLALCSTSISDKAVAMLIKLGYNKATISLDNDNPIVIMANGEIRKRLGWMKEVARSSLSTDPKHYDPDELKERLR
jgi:hypothetical protein